MSTGIHLHRAERMEAQRRDRTEWLKIFGDGWDVAIFMPFDQADAIAAAFHGYTAPKVEAAE